MTRRLIPAAALALALSGCFGGGKPPAALMTLTPARTRAAAEPRAATQARAIAVATPDAPRAIATNRVPVYVDATTIQYLRGAQWVESPADLLRDLLSETIAARTDRAVLDPSLYTQAQGAVLSGRLLRFGFDPNSREAVIDYEGTLTQADRAVVTNRFSAHVSVADDSPAAVGAALNQAANQIADQVADWVGN